ncbi:MAG TPA: polymer-forming cytoskeletal protein [Usitatibacteraceae bacterium]|nr:polymer-forming cytoskeletal protein [Usitatibacteraceae bacterium]
MSPGTAVSPNQPSPSQPLAAVPRTGVAAPAPASAAPVRAASDSAPRVEEGAGSKLIVGPNIKLRGVEIDDCDTLVVEGRVEATMVSRSIQIAETGSFKGSADIEVAEIRGAFDGELTVRGRLVVHATGRISGKVRYGKLLVQEGGELTGDIGTLAERSGIVKTA